MCLESSNDVKVAQKDITVYKVVRRVCKDFRFLFRDINGIEVGSSYLVCENIDNVNEVAAVGFDDPKIPKGYMTFDEFIYAKSYCIRVRRSPEHEDFASNMCIIRMTIPKGTRYQEGRIKSGYIGGMLPAIRSERLRKPKRYRKTKTITMSSIFSVKYYY